MRAWTRLIAMLLAGWFCVAVSLAAQNQVVKESDLSPLDGRVVGRIDGMSLVGNQVQIFGWACQQGSGASISVQIYADRSSADTPRGSLVLSGAANVTSEPVVARACQENYGGKHRFRVNLPNQILSTLEGRRLFVNGVNVAGVIDSTPLGGSGLLRFPKAPATYPPIAGAYRSSESHPRVFMTTADLMDFVTRINTPGTFSARNFAHLAASVKSDLASGNDWDAAYSGCDLNIYLHAFSIEERRGYAGQTRTEDQLSAAMQVKPGASAPTGAAPVASRLALYAALVKVGVTAPVGAPSPDQAAALAKRILLAWANRGLRDGKGAALRSAAQFCDDKGRIDPNVQGDVGLQIGRGIVYSVHAQDLLQAIGGLSTMETTELNSFHSAVFDLLHQAANYRFDLLNHPTSQCEVYSNHVPAALAGLLAIARVLDDGRKFTAVVTGADPAIPMALPWVAYFDHAIYGEADRPIACSPNTGSQSLTSHPSFQTPTVAPGEIEDRYRNANPTQGIGYTAGNLKGIFQVAELLRSAGFDLYGYRGAHGQSIEMAAQYYACYAEHAGFYKTVSPENSSACPNYQQYIGDIVNEVEPSIMMGAYRFPKNTALTSLDPAAKVAWSLTSNSLETIRFGRWRD